MTLTSIFRGVGGELELGRTLGGLGGSLYTICPPIFQAWAIHKGQPWDPASFCAAYGGGFALAATGIGSMIALKDRGVAAVRSAINNAPLGGAG